MSDAELAPRRATVRSDVPDADAVAAAIAPDNTDDIETRIRNGAVVTDIERPTTSSLEATLDDYVVALGVASEVAGIAAEHAGDRGVATAAEGDDAPEPGGDAGDASDDAPDAQHADRHADADGRADSDAPSDTDDTL